MCCLMCRWCLYSATSRAVHGLVAIHKPSGVRSRQVCNLIQTLLRATEPKVSSRSRRPRYKVGHGGTLDPMASGVLVIGIGNGTKKLQGYLNGSKEYTATMRLGQQTDTGDCDQNSSIISESPWSHVTKAQVHDAVASFQGRMQQVPPIYSAIKLNGVKAYERARQGLSKADMNLAARPITIHSIAAINVDQLPYISFKCTVSKGTYIRVLVEDIAEKLGTVGHMTALERTRQGIFTTDDCIAYPPLSIADVQNNPRFCDESAPRHDADRA